MINEELKSILAKADHTLLAQTSTWEQIKVICDDAVKYGTASVCIPPCFVKPAAQYLGGRVRVCTVIGFPNGYNTTAVKCFETAEAVENGADEIDMVINIGMVKEGRFDDVCSEIRSVKAACGGKLLKVIIETCLLTEDEKIAMCRAVTDSGAEYIKTSTGFAGGGATREDVALLRKHVGSQVRVKAAGGIKTLDDARDFVALGADRLGTSKLVAEAKKLDETEKDQCL